MYQGIKKKGEFVCFIVLGTTNSPTLLGGGESGKKKGGPLNLIKAITKKKALS
jgi:hypothetical protein